MSFVIKRRLDLSDVGEGWDGCYVEYNPIRSRDNEQLLEIQKHRAAILKNDMEAVKAARVKTVDIIKENLLGGKGFDGEKQIDITKDNLEDLSDDILTELFQLITGQIDAKKKKPSQT